MKERPRLVEVGERIPKGSIGFKGPKGAFYVWTAEEAIGVMEALQAWEASRAVAVEKQDPA